MDKIILAVMGVDLIIALCLTIIIFKMKQKMSYSRWLPIIYLLNKLTILIPSATFVWLLYSYLYTVIYNLNEDVYFGVCGFYIAYAILIGFYLYVQKNQRKLNLGVSVALTAINLTSTYYIIRYAGYIEKFIPANNSHNVYGNGILTGNIIVILLMTLSVIGLILSFLYSHYNFDELTN